MKLISRIIKVIGFLSGFVFIISILNYYMYDDNSYSRVMMHELENQTEIDIVFAGSSVAYRHFNPKIWDEELSCNTFNAGTSAQRPEGTYYLLKYIFELHNPKYVIYCQSATVYTEFEGWDSPTKDYIVFDYMPWSVNKIEYGFEVFQDNLIEGFMPFTRNRNSDLIKTIRDIDTTKKNNSYRTYGYDVYDVDYEKMYPKGYVSKTYATKDGEVGKLNIIQFADYTIRDKDVEYICKIKDLCQKNNCELIIVVPPMPYGSMRDFHNYQDVVEFNKYIAEVTGSTIFDFSLAKPNLFDNKDSDFYDWVHMSGDGADLFSYSCSALFECYARGDNIDKRDYFYESYDDLLASSPWIYNVWIEKETGSYKAYSNYGDNVIPEYAFWASVDNGESWQVIQEYSMEERLLIAELSDNFNMIMVKARPLGSSDDYQQLYKMELE